jgi:hypothetical protein
MCGERASLSPVEITESDYGQEKYIKKIKKIVELYLKKLYEY